MSRLNFSRPSRALLSGISVLALFACTGLSAQSITSLHPGWFDGPDWLNQDATPLRVGRFEFKPAFSYRFSHSTGMPSRSASSRGATDIHRFTPSLSVQYGPSWVLSYTPSWTNYSSDAYASRVSHDVSLNGVVTAGIVGLQLNQSYLKTDEALIETGRQTQRELWSTTAAAQIPLARMFSLQISGEQELKYTNLYTDSRQWSGQTSLNYHPNASLSFGSGVSVGYADIDPGPNQKFSSYFGTASWKISRKLALNTNVGISRRASEQKDAEPLEGPSYSAVLKYQLLEQTGLSLAGSRNFSSSVFSAQATTNTRFTFSLTQRLLGKFDFRGSYSTGDTEYESVAGKAGRSDRTQSWKADLTVPLARRLSSGLFYRHTQNRSNESTFALASDEYGFRVSYRY